MVLALARNDAVVRQIEDLGLSLHVESRDGQQRLVASDRLHQRWYTAVIDGGREDDAAVRLLRDIRQARD